MCLTIPKQVIAVNKNIVKLKAGKKTETAGHIISVKKGDWVLTQNDVIIKKVTAKQAKEILKIINNHNLQA